VHLVKRVRRIRLTTLPPSVSRLSKQCGILNVSQINRSQRPLTEIPFILYVDNVRISQETHLWASTDCYRDIFTCYMQRIVSVARRNVSPVKYELGFYIPEDDILHSHCSENFKSYITLTGWTL
jgi:hypothetical protein